jgi:hypothetical protein
MIGKSVNKPLLAGVFIALAAPTTTIAAPTVHASFIADGDIHNVALKKKRVGPSRQPNSAPENPYYDPNYLKGTNIPRHTSAPPSN